MRLKGEDTLDGREELKGLEVGWARRKQAG